MGFLVREEWNYFKDGASHYNGVVSYIKTISWSWFIIKEGKVEGLQYFD